MHNDGEIGSSDQGVCNKWSVDTEGTRASGITKEIVERFVVEAECSNEHHKHGL